MGGSDFIYLQDMTMSQWTAYYLRLLSEFLFQTSPCISEQMILFKYESRRAPGAEFTLVVVDKASFKVRS